MSTTAASLKAALESVGIQTIVGSNSDRGELLASGIHQRLAVVYGTPGDHWARKAEKYLVCVLTFLILLTAVTWALCVLGVAGERSLYFTATARQLLDYDIYPAVICPLAAFAVFVGLSFISDYGRIFAGSLKRDLWQKVLPQEVKHLLECADTIQLKHEIIVYACCYQHTPRQLRVVLADVYVAHGDEICQIAQWWNTGLKACPWGTENLVFGTA
jgi:hypothetical protein